MKIATWSLVLVQTALVCAIIAAPAAAQNGALKVTSFPTGAAVIVDGVPTGKVTPMSVSLPIGDHLVAVTIPNSGWRELMPVSFPAFHTASNRRTMIVHVGRFRFQ